VTALSGKRHSESYEHIGTIDCVILNLASGGGQAAVLEPRKRSETPTQCTYVGTDIPAGPTPVVFRRPPS